MKTVALYNLGCSKNFVDGENITGYMAANGFTPIEKYEEADVVIVNTCSFIEDATKEAINTIFSMAEIGKERKQTLVVSGCFSQRYREEVAKEFPEVDLWVGTKNWIDELSDFFSITEKKPFHRVLSEPIHSQYLKISEGCSHNCAFCIIPSIRGGFKSRAVEDIVDEAKWLQSQGVKELIVVSQDTSFYGRDMGMDLADLLKTLLDETDFPWIRMMYLHPNFVDQKLLKLVACNDRLVSYFDIPLQHISTDVLKRMGRRPGRDGIYKLVEDIRETVPDATIRSSFILGFPGETQNDYDELCDFVRWAKLDKLGVFPYSPEDGTPAAEMAEPVETELAVERSGAVMGIQQDISRENREDIVGKTVEVIIDRVSDNPDFAFEGRTRGDAPEVDGRVFITTGESFNGDIRKVEVIDCDDYDLFGRFI